MREGGSEGVITVCAWGVCVCGGVCRRGGRAGRAGWVCACHPDVYGLDMIVRGRVSVCVGCLCAVLVSAVECRWGWL